ncbi:MAG TPA: pilus assembly protein TadG-related protein [Catenuloplanes sp.]
MTPPTSRERLRAVVRRLRRDDRGQITPWTIVATLIIIILAGLVFDQGMAMADKVRLFDIAQGAARAGARQVDLATYRSTGVVRLDPDAAATAARTFIAQAGISGTASASPATVTVTVRTARRTQLLHLTGITSIPVSATATAAPATGITDAT